MNILMVTDIYFPDVIGGSARLVKEISKRLVNRGHNICVLTRRANRSLAPEANEGGIRIYRYNVNSQNFVTFVASSLMNTSRVFNQMLKETSFDLINFHQPLSALGVMLSKKTQEIPKVYTFHSSWPREYEIRIGRRGLGSFLRKWIERKALLSCKKVIVLSEFSKTEILNIYKPLSLKMSVVPGGVDTVRFQPPREKQASKAELGIASNVFLLFTLRNLVPRMGLENLIKAMAVIVKEKQNTVLIIGGGGFLEEKLKGLVKDLGLEDYIKFTGLIGDDKLPLYYQAADLFILPSRYLEGFGLVTLEALSCGTLVLGTPVGGTKEILGGLDKDLLFKDIGTDSIAEKILFYLTSKDLLGLSKRCRDFVVSNYSWDRVVAGYEIVYSEVIN